MALGRIVLVRHGETEWSASGQHTSRTDLPLLPEGRERAAVLRSELSSWRFSAVVCSPLRRARETCELAGFGGVAAVWDELHEWNYGEYEGLTTPEIRSARPDWWLWSDGCPCGESPGEVSARADRVLGRLAPTNRDVAIFAHGHILRVLAARWVEMEIVLGARLLLNAGAVSVLGSDRGTRAIERWNA